MHAAVELPGDYDLTAVPRIVRGAVTLGAIESIIVVLMSVITRLTGGVIEAVIGGLVLLAGLTAVATLPGLWTRPRTIEGIAGAAGIGLAAAGVFLLFDVAMLQPLGVYTNRWLEIGGGSNWWYHPVWWMVGTFIPWMGALLLAAQAARGQRQSVPGVMAAALAATVLLAVLAVLLRFPGAHWSLGTFGVAFLPGVALAAAVASFRASRVR
jgi:riboflavin transporter FmnP